MTGQRPTPKSVHGISYAESKRTELERLLKLVTVVPSALYPGSTMWHELSSALLAYEESGDHRHAVARPVPVNGRCPGGDCIVDAARKLLKGAIAP